MTELGNEIDRLRYALAQAEARAEALEKDNLTLERLRANAILAEREASLRTIAAFEATAAEDGDQIAVTLLRAVQVAIRSRPAPIQPGKVETTYSPEQLYNVLENTLLPTDSKKRAALLDLIRALEQPDADKAVPTPTLQPESKWVDHLVAGKQPAPSAAIAQDVQLDAERYRIKREIDWQKFHRSQGPFPGGEDSMKTAWTASYDLAIDGNISSSAKEGS